MSSEPVVFNPLGWVHVRLLGGPRRIGLMAALYAGALLFLSVFVYRVILMEQQVPLSDFADGAMFILMYLMAVILVFVGCAVTKKAVQRDFTTDMISSHRLAPVSGTTALIGYLTGPTAMIFALTGVNWLGCTIFSLLSSQPGRMFLAPTIVLGILLCMAAFCWTLTILAALSTRGSVSIAGVFVALYFINRFKEVAELLPGMRLLLSSAFLRDFTAAAPGTVGLAVIGGMAGQVLMALVFFAAAARKYTRDDVPAFTPLLAFILLALSALLCGLGLRFQDSLFASIRSGPPRWGGSFAANAVQLGATLIALTGLALLPVSAAARLSARWSMTVAKDPATRLPRPRAWWEAPIVAVLLIFGILGAILAPELPGLLASRVWGLVLIPVSCLMALITLGAVARYMYGAAHKAGIALFIIALILWVGPPAVDAAWGAFVDRPSGTPATWGFTSSPIGVYFAILWNGEGPVLAGMGIQAVVMAAALMIARRARY